MNMNIVSPGSPQQAGMTSLKIGNGFDETASPSLPDFKKQNLYRNYRKNKNKRKKNEKKDVSTYILRENIVEGNDVHCLAFTAPLMDFGSHNNSDNEDYGDLNALDVSAKKKWKKLY